MCSRLFGMIGKRWLIEWIVSRGLILFMLRRKGLLFYNFWRLCSCLGQRCWSFLDVCFLFLTLLFMWLLSLFLMLWDTIIFWTVHYVSMSTKAFWHCSFIWPLLFGLLDSSSYIEYDIIFLSFWVVWIVSIYCIISGLTLAFLFNQIWALGNLFWVKYWSFLANLSRCIQPVASLISLFNGIWVQIKRLQFNIVIILLFFFWSSWVLTSCRRPFRVLEQFLDFFIC